jgi:hypothetical protein
MYSEVLSGTHAIAAISWDYLLGWFGNLNGLLIGFIRMAIYFGQFN